MAEISLTRLSGGNTPADGSDPRTFPAIWNASATAIESGTLAPLLSKTLLLRVAGEALPFPTRHLPIPRLVRVTSGGILLTESFLFTTSMATVLNGWMLLARLWQCSLQRLQGMRASCGWMTLMGLCMFITLTLVGVLLRGLVRCRGLAGFCRLCPLTKRIFFRQAAPPMLMLRT